MSIFDDILSQDAEFFCDPDLMPGAEPVTYTPKGGTARPINVQVYRNGPQFVAGLNGVVAPSLEIEVQNHSTRGVTSVNVNGDTVSIAERKGGTAQTMTVNGIVSQDGGMWRLSLT